MKKSLVCLTALLMVASCGKDSKSKMKNKEFINQYMTAYSAQAPGSVTERTSTGSSHRLSYDWENKQFVVKSGEINETEKEIVLKIDGDNIYSYHEDSSATTSSHMVSVMSISWISKTIAELFQKLDVEDNGDSYTVRSTDEADGDKMSVDDAEATIEGGQTVSVTTAKKNNIICDNTAVETTSGQLFRSPTESKNLATVTSYDTSKCGKALTREELRKLDLTKVVFCDFRDTENSKCESDKDMSSLVK